MAVIGPVVIDLVHRMPNSKQGNPKFKVHIGGGQVLTTKTNAAVGFDLQNREWIGIPVMLTVESKGIVKIEKVNP